jgi:hypothetical protein
MCAVDVGYWCGDSTGASQPSKTLSCCPQVCRDEKRQKLKLSRHESMLKSNEQYFKA